ncbi:DUF6503 family protein [Aquimarina sp. RZ0]|uniref:DUF6503 family protein n=1 Tax=Aquimarina sp. RZ0 TaxID=2607730 RepID=UPI0011F2BCF3|nr:DUF6503 family protein [Aquimarina sp. RZ0]KAA1243006.1 hypothetical protein F0000_23085 [Aquimarina sp. RZ0]
MKRILIALVTFIIISCNQDKKQKETESEIPVEQEKVTPVEPDGGIGGGALSISENLIKNIEKAHKKEDFLNYKAISFNINVLFGGKEHLTGKVTMLTNSTKIRIDKKDKSTLLYDGQDVYLSPAEANDKGARFDMFTWTYFFCMPYKLDDPGTSLTIQEDRKLNNIPHSTAKLTFDSGTGDAPDDWYILYADQVISSLQAAAYIVTFGSDGNTTKAEADPHVIRYKGFKNVNRIPFATSWEFYGWTKEKGMTDTKLGEATISDITFLNEEGTVFTIPENAKKILL